MIRVGKGVYVWGQTTRGRVGGLAIQHTHTTTITITITTANMVMVILQGMWDLDNKGGLEYSKGFGKPLPYKDATHGQLE